MSFGLDWLPNTAFAYFLIFSRIGTIMMMMPALGEGMIPARMRLSFALMFALVLLPLVSDSLPQLDSANLLASTTVVFHELAIGLIFGGIARLIVSSAQVAGAVIAYQSGLSLAQSADPTQNGVQGAQVGSFLSFLGITLIFATNLHHVALAAIYDSYKVFPPTAPLMLDDAATLATETVASAFTIGVQMSAPFIIFGLIFNLGLGLLARLMPQVQVFFMAMPANIGIGLLLFALLLTMTMTWYLTHVEAHFAMLRG